MMNQSARDEKKMQHKTGRQQPAARTQASEQQAADSDEGAEKAKSEHAHTHTHTQHTHTHTPRQRRKSNRWEG